MTSPTSIQKDALARARASLDRLLPAGKALEDDARRAGISVLDLDLTSPDSDERAGTEIE